LRNYTKKGEEECEALLLCQIDTFSANNGRCCLSKHTLSLPVMAHITFARNILPLLRHYPNNHKTFTQHNTSFEELKYISIFDIMLDISVKFLTMAISLKGGI
jgi:hypothetical protein